MKLALFDDHRIGVVTGEHVKDISEIIPWDRAQPHASLVRLMEEFQSLKGRIARSMPDAPSYPLDAVKLRAPVPNPSKIIAAPVNFKLHQDEMNAQFNNAEYTVEKLGFFLKAPSSIIGPSEKIVLPFQDRRTDHEAEIAFVVGKKAKDVKASDAANYIFGYFALMDITLRGKEDRPYRKSFDTFTPIGPWIVTEDELGDPHNLQLRLWVNDELRQNANTKDLIMDCYQFFELASHSMTLLPGDIITMGTPEGVNQIQKGDQVKIHIERIGQFMVEVAQ